MKHILLVALAAALSLAGADLTGTWTGTLTVTKDDGSQSDGPAHLVLKQEGTKVTGTAGPDESEQHPIENGKSENGSLSFELRTGETVMKFALKQEENEIKGDVSREREGRTQTAKLAVKRQ
jgi:hypothetical protein